MKFQAGGLSLLFLSQNSPGITRKGLERMESQPASCSSSRRGRLFPSKQLHSTNTTVQRIVRPPTTRVLLFAVAVVVAWFAFPALSWAEVAINRPLVETIQKTTTTVLVGVATSSVGWFYQRMNAHLEHQRKTRDLELQRATEIIEKMASLTDQLLYFQQHQMINIVLRKAKQNATFSSYDQQQWEKYNGIYETFASSENWSLARMCCSFGMEHRNVLRKIYSQFRSVHESLHATYYYSDNDEEDAPQNNNNHNSCLIREDDNGEWNKKGLEQTLQDFKLELQEWIETLNDNLHTLNVGVLRKQYGTERASHHH